VTSPTDVSDAEFFPAVADIYIPPGVMGPEAMSFDVRAFVVRRGDDIALIDTLMQPEHCELILDALARASATFADIRYVILTHHHPDHTGGLAEVARRAPQAQILCGAGDVGAIRASTGVSVDAIGPADHPLGFEVIPTPGHTSGHLCLFDQASSTMLLGDIAGNVGELDRAPARFTEDLAQAETTLRALAERDFETALPSHGDPLLGGAAQSLRRLADSVPSS
jgi:glyoxylase-like metal-dependent hydrolase (beta-lactamase superfamily II)